jgi:two-component system chemotaxis response regulator CheB
MEAGAVTVLAKPDGPGSNGFELHARRLLSAVKVTAEASVIARPHRTQRTSDSGNGRAGPGHPADVVALAASTGGPAAVAQIVRQLPPDIGVPLLLVQHIAPGFETGLTRWMDELSGIRVRLAAEGQRLEAGQLLVAPTGVHMGVSRRRTVTLTASEPIAGFRPSATYLFRSVAAVYGRHALAVVLTGMGSDGSDGLLDLKRAGGTVIAQDRATSVVYGMPRAAVEAGTADRVLPLADIGLAITTACRR